MQQNLVKLLSLNPEKLSKKQITSLNDWMDKNQTFSFESFESEIGLYQKEISLSKIKPDRRELDKIIMGEILGLSDEEQLEVYRSVVHLVKNRIEKAKSVEKKNKFADGIDMEMAKRDATKEIKTRSK